MASKTIALPIKLKDQKTYMGDRVRTDIIDFGDQGFSI